MLTIKNTEGTTTSSGRFQVFKKTMDSDGSIYCPRYTWLISVVVHTPAAASLNIGTTLNGIDILQDWPLVQGANTLQVSVYCDQVTTLYFTMATPLLFTVAYILTGIKLP